MKALLIESEGVSRFTDVARPKLGEGDVRVAVRHVGICGSDLNTFRGLNRLWNCRAFPGTKSAERSWRAARTFRPLIKRADGVIVLPYTSCGTCSSCRKGRVNACRYNRTLGVQQDGGLAEEIVLPAKSSS